MESYEKLLEDIDDTAQKITELYDLAFHQYSCAVDEVLADHLTDESQIGHLLDGLLDFGVDPRFLELSKKLCRHIYTWYPQLVGDFVYSFRMLFEEKDDDRADDTEH